MVRFIFTVFLFLSQILYAVDFDVVVVGSSPISLLEALYNYHTGKRVLVLEESPVYGGAWKSIDVCGIFPVDLGCHTLGNDKKILHFLEEYIGCRMVSMDNPHLPFDSRHSSNGYYPSKGCYEIIQNLFQLIEKTDIVVLCDHLLESVFIDPQEPIATIRTQGKQFTASKILVTPFSYIQIENDPSQTQKDKKKFYHLYLLVEDPSPPRFSFRTGVLSGVSRLMNLTYFVGLEGTGTQLIVLQAYGQHYLESKEAYLEMLKKYNLLDSSAHILKTDQYIYEQSSCILSENIKNSDKIFEILNTSHIQEMMLYIPKWQQVLLPFDKAIAQ